MNDGYRCELCGAWIEYRNLGNVLDHEGPLPHGTQDRLAGKMAPTATAKTRQGTKVRLNQFVSPVSN